MTTAALLIDLQVDFFAHPRLQFHRPRLTASVNELATILRGAGCPIVW
jgi:nicotinamidase-related amidase